MAKRVVSERTQFKTTPRPQPKMPTKIKAPPPKIKVPYTYGGGK